MGNARTRLTATAKCPKTCAVSIEQLNGNETTYRAVGFRGTRCQLALDSAKIPVDKQTPGDTRVDQDVPDADVSMQNLGLFPCLTMS